MPGHQPPVPALTSAEMAQVDRIMMDELGLDVLQLMELAGRAVAVFARERFLRSNPRGRRVVILAGNGGNGGDGMVAARLLHGWGTEVQVWLGRNSDAHQGAAAHQLRILQALNLPVVPPDSTESLPDADLLIDALLGFGLQSAPTGATAALIRAANGHGAPTLAVDVPSGLDGTTGTVYDPCIHADATLTLALPKTGLLVPSAHEPTGDLHLADIGVPAEAYAPLGHNVGPIFAQQEIIRLR